MEIRLAKTDDAEALLAIYTPYVEKTAITFEYDVPSIDEFRNRIIAVSAKYPWLVAVDNGNIVGYAYASAFKERAAYQWSVETSIYVDKDRKRSGTLRRTSSCGRFYLPSICPSPDITSISSFAVPNT